MRYEVLICDSKTQITDQERQASVLEEFDATLRSIVTDDPEQLIDELEGVDGLIVDAGVPVTKAVIDGAPSLNVIGRAGIGVDNVDLRAATEHDIRVVHHPTYCIDDVATHTLSLLFACLRGLRPYDRSTSSGDWDWTIAAPIPRLQRMTIGLLGFGKIPRRIATMVTGFGCRLLAYDPYVDDAIIRSQNVEPTGFEDLLERVDVLSIHTPLTDETHGMIDGEAFDRLSSNAILINTARGPVIDTDALCDALRSDAIGRVGLDVTDPEPLPSDHLIRTHEDVILTPHVAWYSEASRVELGDGIARDVGRVLTGQPPMRPVSNDHYPSNRADQTTE